MDESTKVADQRTVERSQSDILVLRARLRRLLRENEVRTDLFGWQLAAPSAFDLILSLYAAELNGRQNLVSHVGEASGLPQTTALRWLKMLEAEGWVARLPGPLRRRTFVIVLTDRARTALKAYLEERST